MKFDLKTLEAIGSAVEKAYEIGIATAPRIKAIIAAFTLSDEDLNARLSIVEATADEISKKALAEAAR